jgi:23S rRNA pseudouridine2605 synthase
MPRIMALVRLQKVLAKAGVASRRKAEELIEGGRVRVNGVIVTELGTKVDERRDKIEVNGRRVVAEKPAYYVVHKPRGMVTTMDDPEGRPSRRSSSASPSAYSPSAGSTSTRAA